jgi:ribosome-associated toxin RatA of RatAB toxin-antitoxin module
MRVTPKKGEACIIFLEFKFDFEFTSFTISKISSSMFIQAKNNDIFSLDLFHHDLVEPDE